MSHNVLKVNNSNASNNNINVNLSDLCSVSNIQTNDIIKHNGTNFVNSTASGGGSFTYSDVYYNKRFHWHSDAGGGNHANGSFHLGSAYNNAYQNGDYWIGGLKRNSTWQNYKHIDSSVSENESTTHVSHALTREDTH